MNTRQLFPAQMPAWVYAQIKVILLARLRDKAWARSGGRLPGPGEPNHDPREYFDSLGKPPGYWTNERFEAVIAQLWAFSGQMREPEEEVRETVVELDEPLPLAA